MEALAIAGCSVCGALLRLVLAHLVAVQMDSGTIASLMPNFVGCVIMGALCATEKVRLRSHRQKLWWVPVCKTGFCGALTTFSMWNLELATSLQNCNATTDGAALALLLGGGLVGSLFSFAAAYGLVFSLLVSDTENGPHPPLALEVEFATYDQRSKHDTGAAAEDPDPAEATDATADHAAAPPAPIDVESKHENETEQSSPRTFPHCFLVTFGLCAVCPGFVFAISLEQSSSQSAATTVSEALLVILSSCLLAAPAGALLRWRICRASSQVKFRREIFAARFPAGCLNYFGVSAELPETKSSSGKDASITLTKAPGTLLCNLLACLIVQVLWSVKMSNTSSQAVILTCRLIMVGFCGSLSTLSALAEDVFLVCQPLFLAGICYFLATITLCVVANFGVILGNDCGSQQSL